MATVRVTDQAGATHDYENAAFYLDNYGTTRDASGFLRISRLRGDGNPEGIAAFALWSHVEVLDA